MLSFIKSVLRTPVIIVFMLLGLITVIVSKKIREKLLNKYYNNEIEELAKIILHEVDVFSFFLYLGITIYFIKTIYFI